MDIPKFKEKKDLFNYLKENEEDLIWEKKASFKKADGLNLPIIAMAKTLDANKAHEDQDPGVIKVRAIINTTMVRDSHKDVHLNGIWNKSLKENKMIKHLQEHNMSFKSIISDKDDLKAYVKTYSWRDLGVDAEGKTQALVFDSTVKEDRNPYMFSQYKDGHVDNHSVGMRYVTIKMAFDSDEEDDEKYKAEFDKHINEILNKDEVKEEGFYFAVYEAKAMEGSAVPLGSNTITPTQSVKEVEPEQNDKLKALELWLNK